MLISLENQILAFKNIASKIPVLEKIPLVSEWAEANISLTRDVSPVTGPYSYEHTPYWREPADFFHPDSPDHIMVIVKGGQSGATQGVVVPVSVHTVACDPCNIMVTSANKDLSDKFVNTRFDPAIDSAGLTHLLRPNVIRSKNAKTGNTDSHKIFAGGNGYFNSVGSIDSNGKQISLTKGLFDDWSASKLADSKQGNLFSIIDQRFNTSAFTQKRGYISTPEMSPDPTWILYLQGDQRKWFVPCPCCGEMIELKFNDTVEGKKVGLIYDTDENGKLIEGTVRYRCQECYGEFTEREKFRIMGKGKWIATSEPQNKGWRSYHLSALYGAPNMYSWTDIVLAWIKVFSSGKCDPDKLKPFNNLMLGIPFEDLGAEADTNILMSNSGAYQYNTIPDLTAESFGCDPILMVTVGVDLGGTPDDARIDYEVVAWTTSMQSFSIDEGTIGTFSNNKKIKDDPERIKWSYRFGSYNCVWNVLDEIGNRKYSFESDVNYCVQPYIVCIDYGHLPEYVDSYILRGTTPAVPVKGNGDLPYVPGSDLPLYSKSSEKVGLYSIKTNYIKSLVMKNADIDWDSSKGVQPAGFMNFPEIADGKYQPNGYFKQLTGEKKELAMTKAGTAKGFIWKPKPGFENHKFDCRCYAYVGVQIAADLATGKQKTSLPDLYEYFKKN